MHSIIDWPLDDVIPFTSFRTFDIIADGNRRAMREESCPRSLRRGGEPSMESGNNLDNIAISLLEELQKDARASYAELGRRVGLSPSATAERMRRLEDSGVIRGYRVEIDPAALGLGVMAHIRMVCDGEKYKLFVQFVKTLDAVRECNHVTGSEALMMKVLVPSLGELEELVMKLLNYGTPTTSVVLSEVLTRREFSLKQPKAKKYAR
jgi:Lrp/AsnC family leucine-responsive transcriptional regulator